MRCVWAILFAASLSAGCGLTPVTSDPPPELSRDSTSSPWTQPAKVVGQVPLNEALQELVRAEILDHWPTGQEPTTLTIRQGARLGDVRDAIENACMWVFADRKFNRFAGFGSNDAALMLGRPRTRVKFSIRFVRVNASASMDEITAGATIFRYVTSLPDGQEWQFSNTTERSRDEGIEGVLGNDGVVRTQRKVYQSGVQFRGVVMMMPGGYARTDGDLEVSSFVGSSVDRAQTTAPLKTDFKRREWVAVHLFQGADASLVLNWRGLGTNVGGGGDMIRVDVRVD